MEYQDLILFIMDMREVSLLSFYSDILLSSSFLGGFLCLLRLGSMRGILGLCCRLGLSGLRLSFIRMGKTHISSSRG